MKLIDEKSGDTRLKGRTLYSHCAAMVALALMLTPISACGGSGTDAGQGGQTASGPAPTPTPAPSSTEVPAPALPGDWDLAANLGVNTHLEWLDSSYADTSKVISALAYLGIRRVRDVSPSWYLTAYQAAADQGACFDFFVRADGAGNLPGILTTMGAFATRVPGSICAIEGLNEANNWPASAEGLSGLPGAIAVQKKLYQLVKSDAKLRDIPVYNLTLGAGTAAQYAQLGNLSAFADFGNVHAYYDARPAIADMAFAINLAHGSTPQLATDVLTETGYSTARNHNRAVDEQVQAKYVLTLIAEAARLNLRSTYLYQLVDPFPDPTGTDIEMGFGLYRSDWTAKPAADALHYFTQAMAGAKIVSTADAAKIYTLRGGDAQTQSLLFRDAAQTLKIVIWRNLDLWDETTRSPLNPSNLGVTLQFATSGGSVVLRDPMSGSDTTLTPSSSSDIAITLPDHPVIVTVRK